MRPESQLLWRLIGQTRGWLALAALLAALAAASSIGLVAAAGWLITASAIAGLAATGLEIFLPGAIVRALAVSRTLTRYAERLLAHESIFRVLAKLRRAVFSRLAHLPIGELAKRRASQDNQRLIHDIERLESWPVEMLLPSIAASAAGLLLIVLTVWIAPGWLAALLLVLVALIGLLIASFRQAHRPALRHALDQQQLGQQLQETLLAADTLWHCDPTQRQARRCCQRHQRTLQREQMRQLRAIRDDANIQAMFGLLVLGLLTMASQSAGAEAAWPVLLLLATLAFAGLLLGLPQALWRWASVAVSARRVLIQPTTEARPDPATDTTGAPSLAIRRLFVRHGVSEHPLYQQFNLRLAAGQWCAVVGASGSGKSTLLRLFAGLQQPDAGEILIDGKPPTGDDRARLARLAVLTQETVILDDSLRNNLLIGSNRPLDDSELGEHLQALGLDDLAQELDRWIGPSGQPLSGGQARRIALLRCCLSDAPGMILDEPFRGLDEKSQQRVRRWLYRNCQGRTLLLLDHQAPRDWPGRSISLD